MFTLKRLRSGVYLLDVDSPKELAMMFLRYQEFYESSNDNIREKQFTLVDHIVHYTNKTKTNSWTYPDDFGGFNIPVDEIDKCVKVGILDPNHYDSLMKGVAGMIKSNENDASYLIGVSSKDTDEYDREGYLDHELTHAMFFLNEAYRIFCINKIDNLSKHLSEQLFDALHDEDYPDKVIPDEIQAYITTGESGFFDSVTRDCQEELDTLRNDLRNIHRQIFDLFKEEKDDEVFKLCSDAFDKIEIT